MNYIVYKTINLINNKYYVGVHRTNPDIFDGYIGCGVTNKDKKNKKLRGFPAAVRKYGYNNFKRITLFIYPDTEEGKAQAYSKEAEIVNIDFVKSNKTYNLTLGGRVAMSYTLEKEIAQYTLDGIFIRTWRSIKEASEFLNLTAISNNLIGKSKYCGDFQWRYFNGNTNNIEPVTKKEKSVYQFDLQGNLIKSWKSAICASEQFANPDSARVLINNVCLNKHLTAYGYYWSYKSKFDYNPPKVKRAVAKYNDNGDFIQAYDSITEAANLNNIKTKENIIAAIKGLQKRCGGFRWRYFYGNTTNIKSL